MAFQHQHDRAADPTVERLAPEERYFSFSRYLRGRFGARVYKATIDAGFTCPNRDGTLGVGGCSFCNNSGFSVNSRGRREPVAAQLERGAAFLRRRYRAEKFLAYFQAYTNTYDSIDALRERYDAAMARPDVVGLDVGTRPDCVPDDVLDLLQSYLAPERDVWLELGLQSSHDHTLERVNRGHGFAEFEDAMRRAAGRGLKLCVHVILGLPGESRDDMLETAERLAAYDYHGVKIHLLHILKRTPMEAEWRRGEIPLLEPEDYAELVVDFLERVPPGVAVHRMTADAPPATLVAPEWCSNKARVTGLIHEAMSRRGFRQGSRRGPKGASLSSSHNLTRRLKKKP